MPYHFGKGEKLLQKKIMCIDQFIQMNSEISVRDDLLIDVELSLWITEQLHVNEQLILVHCVGTWQWLYALKLIIIWSSLPTHWLKYYVVQNNEGCQLYAFGSVFNKLNVC